MKAFIPFFILFTVSFSVKAQSVGGLWQGKWSSPEGYVFDFVLHLDEFPDGTLTGYINWVFQEAPAHDFYYANRKGQEATEFVEGKIRETGKIDFEGIRKDDPKTIISLDKYQLLFDPGFGSFTGTTGHHGSRTGKIEGVRIGLP